jgi:hypothetical protein
MSRIKVERTSLGWTATICRAGGSMKIFAASKEEALRKIAHFNPKQECQPPIPSTHQ